MHNSCIKQITYLLQFLNFLSLMGLLNLKYYYSRNLRTAFRDPVQSQGIYLVDPLADKTSIKKPTQPVKLLSVEGLKKALRY